MFGKEKELPGQLIIDGYRSSIQGESVSDLQPIKDVIFYIWRQIGYRQNEARNNKPIEELSEIRVEIPRLVK